MLSKFSVVRLTFQLEKVMNMHPQVQSIASILRAEIETWRRAGSISREAVAASVLDTYQALGGEGATGVDFIFVGDTYTQAKKAAQKLFRWLDVDGTLPANIVPSILAALPLDVRMRCLNQMFCPLGVEVRAAGCGQPAGLDVSKHLRAVMKEGGEAQLALLNLSPDASDNDLLAAHKELIEAAQACENAACDAMAKVVARQTLAKACAQPST
jgi:hypothetical protein